MAADRDSEKSTIIGPETRVSGELRGDEDVIVRGRVDGRVVVTSVFTVEEGAIVQADVEARVVLISGVVVGNVNGGEIIRLTDKARVVGDLTAPRVVVEAGAAFRGRLDMGDIEAGAAASARTTARRTSEAPREAAASKAPPPRMAAAARVAASPGSVSRAPAPPPRSSANIPSAPMRGAPPSLPRPETAAAEGVASGAAAAAWAKKKLQRRR